jgi:Flp pilus assembly protein TadG
MQATEQEVSMNRNIREGIPRQEGSSLLEVALAAPLLLLLLVGAVDIGRAYFYAIEVSSAAEAGALYGSQNPTDTSGMVSAAKLDASGIAQIVPAASYGCECADGTSVSPACSSAPVCSSNIVNYVEVDTSYAYTPIFSFPGIQSSFPLTARARMHAFY